MCARSFSVVQNTTTGVSPPAVPRSVRRKSMPFITGMFQSSRITSGICLRHASMASLPSAASSMAKCKSSSMRRATFRTTFESSTMRQDFMPRFSLAYSIDGPSGRSRSRGQIQRLRHVEHDQQIAVETVAARGYLAPDRVEGHRVALGGARAKAQDLADAVDQQAVELSAVIDHHVHRGLTLGAWWQPQANPNVDRGHDATTQIERARDLRGRERDARDALSAQHVLHLQHRNTEHLVGDGDPDEIAMVGGPDHLAARELCAKDTLAHAAPRT